MSGGSMDYLSYKVEDATFRENTPERKAFRLHLRKVAEALHKIEWNDSGDGADGESEAIRACISPVLSTGNLGAEACRAAFVAMVKEENFYSGPGGKQSLRAHWTGPAGGFADEMLQRRWRDFEAGWKARNKAVPS